VEYLVFCRFTLLYFELHFAIEALLFPGLYDSSSADYYGPFKADEGLVLADYERFIIFCILYFFLMYLMYIIFFHLLLFSVFYTFFHLFFAGHVGSVHVATGVSNSTSLVT